MAVSNDPTTDTPGAAHNSDGASRLQSKQFSAYPRDVLAVDDWPQVRQRHIDWWNRKGLVFWVTAPRDGTVRALSAPPPDPPPSVDPETKWYDPDYRVQVTEYQMAQTFLSGDAFPLASGWSAAGDLGVFLGAKVHPVAETVWMYPIIDDPDNAAAPASGSIRLDPCHPWLVRHLDLVLRLVQAAGGRYFVGMPDLVENIDILASLRGTEPLLMDMIDRPQWVEQRLWEINEAFFAAFDLFYQAVSDCEGGNSFVFNLWGPGRTAKVQCDACSMFGPQMFRRFVTPALTDQCRRLDYAMYHLDGESCLPNLDELLQIEPLQAIEWTPSKLSVGEGGGRPQFYELYKRILSAEKGVQAIGVDPDDVIPLLDACGAEGMFITCRAKTEEQACALCERVDRYR